jgi:hypothetical protein
MIWGKGHMKIVIWARAPTFSQAWPWFLQTTPTCSTTTLCLTTTVTPTCLTTTHSDPVDMVVTIFLSFSDHSPFWIIPMKIELLYNTTDHVVKMLNKNMVELLEMHYRKLQN